MEEGVVRWSQVLPYIAGLLAVGFAACVIATIAAANDVLRGFRRWLVAALLFGALYGVVVIYDFALG